MTAELGWDHPIQDIPETGLSVERTASPEERDAIAQALDLVACSNLTVRYKIIPGAEGHFRLTGSLEARVEQSCVVTLEPLTNEVAESFSVDFWPEMEMPEPTGGVLDVHDDPDLEPIVAGRIEVGRIVFQSLAGGIDLFPRKPGATFEPPASHESAGKGEGPFAALAKMRGKR